MSNSDKLTASACILALATFGVASFAIVHFNDEGLTGRIGDGCVLLGSLSVLGIFGAKSLGNFLYPDRGVIRDIYGDRKPDFSGVFDQFLWGEASRRQKVFFFALIAIVLVIAVFSGMASAFSLTYLLHNLKAF